MFIVHFQLLLFWDFKNSSVIDTFDFNYVGVVKLNKKVFILTY